MSDQNHSNPDTDPSAETSYPSFDKFAELRTMPSGWDLSELLNTAKASQNGWSCSAAPQDSPTGAAGDGDTPPGEPDTGWNPHPFPKPQTFPTHWKFS